VRRGERRAESGEQRAWSEVDGAGCGEKREYWLLVTGYWLQGAGLLVSSFWMLVSWLAGYWCLVTGYWVLVTCRAHSTKSKGHRA